MEYKTAKNIIMIFALLSFSISAVNCLGKDTQTTGDILMDKIILEAESDAIEWLKEQIVPNDIVPSPDLTRRRLIVSYLIPENDPAYPYIFSRSFIYDDALAIIALTMAGKYREAEYMLNALRRLIREDGSFWFTYNTVNNWPNEDYHEGAMIRNGAIAWVGYAITFYLNTCLKKDKDLLENDRIAAGFLKMAESIGSYILKNQVLDPSDRRYGLVKGGWASQELISSDKSMEPLEDYIQSDILWVSTEHNIDIYFFLRDLSRLTQKKEYLDAAELVKNGLLSLWSEKEWQLFRGIKEDQRIDNALPLDGASWASIFLFSIGEDEKARRCLVTIENRFLSKSKGNRGYIPYSSEYVYEDKRLNKYYYPNNPEMRWDNLGLIWIEGSLGVAAANIKAGDTKKALEIIKEMLLIRSGKGFKYANIFVPYKMSDYPGVASTAWFVIIVNMLKNSDINILFWGK